MPDLLAVSASNQNYSSPSPPVAIVLGGTAGMGRSIAALLANLTNGAINLIVLGRNEAAAADLFATLPQHACSKYEFERIDCAKISDVARVTTTLQKRLTKLNFIITTAGAVQLSTTLTDEGNIPIVAVTFLARYRFIHNLLPLLEKTTTSSGERVGVLDVASAGMGGNVDLNDLSLEKRGWRFAIDLRPAMGTYHDAIMEGFSRRYLSVHFIHTYPGLVTTDFLGRMTGMIFRYLGWGKTPDESAQFALYSLLSSEQIFPAGVTRLNENAEPIGLSIGINDEVIEKVWNFAAEKTKINNAS